ncbi:MAG: sugar isomerase domain-containing protein [Kiritimatiellae bacterium]|nr:sugar isomerase domain-containing protein [Kiritimatiellia bacterium]
MSEYIKNIVDVLMRIEAEEANALSSASDAVAEVICRDGLVHVFGCGHSHLAALDTFYRAGGLACVSPLLDEDLMLHDGAAKSSRMEKMPGIAIEAFRRASVDSAKDLLVVISASGKNAAPVEMLRTAKAAGVKTVAISSSAYTSHGGVMLAEADIAIDCKVPYGDAVIEVGTGKMGGLSTYASLFILNSVLIEGAKKALARSVTPPIYTSGNVEGGMARNIALEERYFGRVKRL